jgi:hypothetical protein
MVDNLNVASASPELMGEPTNALHVGAIVLQTL